MRSTRQVQLLRNCSSRPGTAECDSSWRVSPATASDLLELKRCNCVCRHFYVESGMRFTRRVLATSPIGPKYCVSGDSSIVMMKPAEHWERDDVALWRAHGGNRRLLAEPLVRARGVEVADVLGDHAVQMPVVEHQDMVEALATQLAEKAFADGIHVGRAHRRADYPDAGGNGQRIEGGPKLAVSVANQELRCHAEGGRVTKLLRDPWL